MPIFLSDRLGITSKRVYTDEGFLVVPARIARTGIQEYLAVEMGLTDREPNDIIKVFRSEEEVFSDKSLQSFANKPVTNNHPPELVNASNSREFTVGMSGPEVSRDGMFSAVTLHVTDAEAIRNIESGKVELSNGYTSDIEWRSGITPDGENFDAVQTNIKGNHIAIVERGRAGPDCKLADDLPETGDKLKMGKITIDGVDFEVSEQASQAVGKLQVKLSDAENEIKKKDEELEEKDEELKEKEEKAKKDEEESKAKTEDALSKIPNGKSLDKMVADRTALISSVVKILPDLEWEGKDAITLKREIVSTTYEDVQVDSESDEYVNAAFDLICKQNKSKEPDTTLDEALQVSLKDKNKVTDTRPLDVIARDNMMERSRNLWKGDK